MNKIRVFLVDDENGALKLMQSLLSHFNEVEVVGMANNVSQAVSQIAITLPDMVFTDIRMPGEDGFALVKALHEKGIFSCHVFVTAYDQYTLQACKTAAFDYLLKPVGLPELGMTLKRFQEERIEKPWEDKLNRLLQYIQPHEKVRFNTRSGYILIDPQEILYCHAEGNYTDIFLINGSKETVTLTLKDFSDRIINPSIIRVSRSYLINKTFISKVDRKRRKCELRYQGISLELDVSMGECIGI